jgi:hypothetical protein
MRMCAHPMTDLVSSRGLPPTPYASGSICPKLQVKRTTTYHVFSGGFVNDDNMDW